MLYSAPIGTLTHKQAKTIQSAPINALVRAMGYNAHMPRVVVHGPTKTGGIGLNHLFIAQGALKVKTLLQYIRQNKQTGKILILYLSWAQLVAGGSSPILENPSQSLPHLHDEQWLTTL